MEREIDGQPVKQGAGRLRSVGLLALIVCAAALWAAFRPGGLVDGLDLASRRTRALDNLKSLQAMIMSQRAEPTSTRKLSGKAYVLSVVTRGQIRPEDTRALRVLFAPGHEPQDMRSLVSQYRSLVEPTFFPPDLATLTSFFGRALTPTNGVNVPMLADLTTDPNAALVALRDGTVRVLDRDALGIGPNDPIIAGPDSPAPALRLLAPN